MKSYERKAAATMLLILTSLAILGVSVYVWGPEVLIAIALLVMFCLLVFLVTDVIRVGYVRLTQFYAMREYRDGTHD